MKSTRCQVPRRSSPSRTGIDSPAEPSNIDMQCVAVPELHVLLADVLGAGPSRRARSSLLRDEPFEERGEVVHEALLELVDAHAARRVRRVDTRDPVLDAALGNSLVHLVGDVADRETPGRSQSAFVLEDLHG